MEFELGVELEVTRGSGRVVPDGDVEDVGAHGAGDGHVSQPLAGHDDAGDEVGDGRPSRQDGQPHDLFRDAHGLAHL